MCEWSFLSGGCLKHLLKYKDLSCSLKNKIKATCYCPGDSASVKHLLKLIGAARNRRPQQPLRSEKSAKSEERQKRKREEERKKPRKQNTTREENKGKREDIRENLSRFLSQQSQTDLRAHSA